MTTTTLSSKGQVIIPKAVREAKGWHAGDEFVVEVLDGGVLLRPSRRVLEVRPTTIEEVLGCAGYRGPRMSLRDMEEGVRRGARRSM